MWPLILVENAIQLAGCRRVSGMRGLLNLKHWCVSFQVQAGTLSHGLRCLKLVAGLWLAKAVRLSFGYCWKRGLACLPFPTIVSTFNTHAMLCGASCLTDAAQKGPALGDGSTSTDVPNAWVVLIGEMNS